MSVEAMAPAFRQGDALLNCALGLLSWCDAVASAVAPHPVEQTKPEVLAERRLLERISDDDAMHLILGLIALERSLRGPLGAERDRGEARSRALPAIGAPNGAGIGR